MLRKLDHFFYVRVHVALCGGSGSENRPARLWLCFLLAAPLFPPETHLFVLRKRRRKRLDLRPPPPSPDPSSPVSRIPWNCSCLREGSVRTSRTRFGPPPPPPFLCNFHSGEEVLEGECMPPPPPPVEVLLAHCGGGCCGSIESMAFPRPKHV